MQLNFEGRYEPTGLRLSRGQRVSALSLDCRACQKTFRVARLWGRKTGGKVEFVGRTRCGYCHMRAYLIIRRTPVLDVEVRQIGRWTYLCALLFSRREPSVSSPVSPKEAIVRRSIESLGRYRDEDIPAWIALNGALWAYVGIYATPHRPPARGEVVIEPGLMYRRLEASFLDV